jgi:hypothetical protein
MIQRWNHFWFQPAPPSDLAICRIVFFSFLFLRSLSKDGTYWSYVDPLFWHPVGLFQRFHLAPLHGDIAFYLETVWKLSLLTSAAGLLTRPSTWFACGLGTYFLGIEQNFGSMQHSTALVALLLCVFAVSRCGDALSLDGLFNPKSVLERDSEYHWPLKLGRTLLAFVYFGAAVSKLRYSGLDWALSSQLSILLQQNYALFGENSLAVWLSQHDIQCRTLATWTLATELFFPLALFIPRAQLPLLGSMVAIHVGIDYLMGISFRVFLLSYVFWIVPDVRQRLAALRAQRPPQIENLGSCISPRAKTPVPKRENATKV